MVVRAGGSRCINDDKKKLHPPTPCPREPGSEKPTQGQGQERWVLRRIRSAPPPSVPPAAQLPGPAPSHQPDGASFIVRPKQSTLGPVLSAGTPCGLAPGPLFLGSWPCPGTVSSLIQPGPPDLSLDLQFFRLQPRASPSWPRELATPGWHKPPHPLFSTSPASPGPKGCWPIPSHIPTPQSP